MVATDYSTNDGVSHSMTIVVGQQPAMAGAILTGGEITAHNAGSDPVVLTVVAISVDRCHQVESAAPQPATRVSVPVSGPVAGPVSTAPAPGAESSGAADVLPSTGGTSIELVVAAWCLVVGGWFLWSLSRIGRRPAATTGRGRAT